MGRLMESSGGFQYFDIIAIGLVAGFLLLRLRSILGKKTGRSEEEDGSFRPDHVAGRPDNVIPMPGAENRRVLTPEETSLGSTELDNALARIKSVDGYFDHKVFLSGARAAYEMIIQAFAAGDRPTLQGMVSREVFKSFDGAISDRERDGHTLERMLISIPVVEIIDIEFDGKLASLTVKFVSEQVDSLKDKEGNRLDEDGDAVVEITDIWTFAKNMRSSDPNWTLIATRSAS